MSNRLDMKKDTNNLKDKTKCDGPEKPDAYMGNDKQWVFRALVLAFVDMCIIAISFFFALMIRFEFSYSHIPLSFLEGYLHIVPLFMVISLVVFYIFRLYHSIWRFASINEFMHIIGAFLVLTVLCVIIHEVYEIKMPYAFWIIGLMLSFALCTACRFAYRFIRTGQKMLEQRGFANGDERVMIIGAGNAGRMLIRELIMSSHLHTKACCIIDEITAALDPEMVREVLDVVLDLAKEGRTMVIVTHEMQFAKAVADRVTFLEGGKIVEEGEPKKLFEKPETDRLQRFLQTFTYEKAVK